MDEICAGWLVSFHGCDLYIDVEMMSDVFPSLIIKVFSGFPVAMY